MERDRNGNVGGVEPLEGRRLFSMLPGGTLIVPELTPIASQTVTTSYDGQGTLTVTGTAFADTVRLVANADGADRFRVEGQQGTVFFQGSSSLIERVVVDLKDGDDFFHLTTGDTDVYYSKVFDVRLGHGKNVADIALSQTTFRADSFGNPDWTINIDGGGLQDDVTAALGRRASGFTNLTARLGEGTDFFTGSITGNTDDGRTRMKVYGGFGADVLTGSVAPDFIDGGGGNDVIRGGAGNDKLNGGSEKDELYGEAGNDYLDGGEDGIDADRDIITGGSGIDTFRQYPIVNRLGFIIFSQDLIADREPGELIDDGMTAYPG